MKVTRKVNLSESVGDSTSLGGYDPSFFDLLASVEDRHFWIRSRNRLIFELSKKISSGPYNGNNGTKAGFLVLEVGCGIENVLGCSAKLVQTVW
jgi:hypothetical protein